MLRGKDDLRIVAQPQCLRCVKSGTDAPVQRINSPPENEPSLHRYRGTVATTEADPVPNAQSSGFPQPMSITKPDFYVKRFPRGSLAIPEVQPLHHLWANHAALPA